MPSDVPMKYDCYMSIKASLSRNKMCFSKNRIIIQQ